MAKQRYADYIVCYDIRDDKRLRAVHDCMRQWGIPLQYSVFYCRLSKNLRKRLIQELRVRIDERVDDVRVYTMQASGTIHFQGKAPVANDLIGSELVATSDANHSQLFTGTASRKDHV
ncbi:CRISPR-associated endonuclease Cas2 [Arhodomonas sp. AD133]|uniref:CRISPR-associated endonuclease Cas2 n=1 Tax=Arhodomonas sp. AD133 TaxID=3415009 RepID=UPI003EC11589